MVCQSIVIITALYQDGSIAILRTMLKPIDQQIHWSKGVVEL